MTVKLQPADADAVADMHVASLIRKIMNRSIESAAISLISLTLTMASPNLTGASSWRDKATDLDAFVRFYAQVLFYTPGTQLWCE